MSFEFEWKRVHIIGVCGTLMGAFAALLKRKGLNVTGSDEGIYPPMSDVLREAGVHLFEGYRAENLDAVDGLAPDLIVIGNVISGTNLEAVAAFESGIRVVSLPEFMHDEFLSNTTNVLACGTHGKTTTASMMAHVLNRGEVNPSYFFGGVSLDLPHSFHVGDKLRDSPFVIEGDEYDVAYWDKVPKFNYYRPDHVILTSIEYDHADIYPAYEDLLLVFDGLIDRIRPGGRLIACKDYPLMDRMIKRATERNQIEIVTYGSHLIMQAEYTIQNLRDDGEWSTFEVHRESKALAEIRIRHSGMHNALNATAVWIEAKFLGLSDDQVLKALESYRGVKRRQQIRGKLSSGALLIEDFAHHPTAVRETLDGLKKRYSGRRLLVAFEPRSATSRRDVFQKPYAKSFGSADFVWISEAYDQSKIAESERFSSRRLVDDLNRSGDKAQLFDDVLEARRGIQDRANKDDVVIVMSNGGFGGLIDQLLGNKE